MTIEIIAVGSIKETFMQAAVNEYKKRLGKYGNCVISEIKEAKEIKHLSDKAIEAMLDEEGNRILSKISQDSYVIALAIEGKMIDTQSFVKTLEDVMSYHSGHIVFVIGGSHGLSETVKKRADYLLSFSKMTLPHQLMRIVLLEQIYRVMKIRNNEPYHK